MGTDDREASATVPPVRPRCKCHSETMIKNGIENRPWRGDFGQQQWRCTHTMLRHNERLLRRTRDRRTKQRRVELDVIYRGEQLGTQDVR